MTLEKALKEYQQAIGPYGHVPTIPEMDSVVAFIRGAKVYTKKIGVSKKGGDSNLFHRGVWGFPKVFIESGPVTVQVKGPFWAAPFLEDHHYVQGEAPGMIRRVDIDLNKPAVPRVFCEKPFGIVRHQYNSEPLGIWLAESCHKIHDLDHQVREAWAKQEETFLAEAERYVAKFSGKQRELFQSKLVKELAKNRNALVGMNPRHIYELFRFAVDQPNALNSLVNFCARNRADAAFIDESDIVAAIELAKVNEVMKA